jgi:hypothetical protein
VFVILLVVSKFLVMKAEHTVANYNGSDFTMKIATVYYKKTVTMCRSQLQQILTITDFVKCSQNEDGYRKLQKSSSN